LTGYYPSFTDFYKLLNKEQVSFASSLTMIQN
jgi:hypothetical protein